MKAKQTTRYTAKTQRTHALDTEYFTDCQKLADTLELLRTRGEKSASQWRLDCRKAHAIEKQNKQRVKRSYGRLLDTTGLKLAKNRKTDNRQFTVVQISDLDYSHRFKTVGGGTEFDFKERYKKERYVLDKMQTTRSKN